jgi:hypothetical protein
LDVHRLVQPKLLGHYFPLLGSGMFANGKPDRVGRDDPRKQEGRQGKDNDKWD